jgi:hypothetical protein
MGTRVLKEHIASTFKVEVCHVAQLACDTEKGRKKSWQKRLTYGITEGKGELGHWVGQWASQAQQRVTTSRLRGRKSNK